MPYPRGRALGGSSAINAMAHVRGHRAVYDGWAAAGAAGWAFADLLPFFNRLSSYLFNLARYENKKAGRKEDVWKS